MAELINNRQQRIAAMTSIIRQLHAGVPTDQVRAQMRELVRVTDATEIAAMEQQLMDEGMPVAEVMAMCDVHADVAREILLDLPRPVAVDDHPAAVLRAENDELLALIQRARSLLAGDHADAAVLAELRAVHELLGQVSVHYQRKEHLIFPILERYGITGPSTVMWAKDDEARGLVAAWGQSLAADPVDVAAMRQAAAPALHALADMVAKENDILVPMAMQTFAVEDWEELRGQQEEFGYAWIDPPGVESPGPVAQAPRPGATAMSVGLPDPVLAPHLAGAPSATTSAASQPVGLAAPSGALSPDQLAGIFAALPVDLTFIDADDRVGYFTEGSERVFPRPRAIVGRKVQQCHPPASVAVVEQILSDFRSGAASQCAFWIEHHDKFVHIQYLAVRDGTGTYLGTLEVTQDLTGPRALTGERRLLEYDTPSS
jgi:DUF438 domain-containing protein